MNKKDIKLINTIRVLRTLWLNEGVSRIEIADMLGLDKSTITNIVNTLLEKKFVTELEEGTSGPQGGRKPIKLTIDGNRCAIAGIEVQPEYCHINCLNLSGDLLFSKRVNGEFSAESFTERFSEFYTEIVIKLKTLGIPLAGIGLGFSGIVYPAAGIIHESIPLGVEADYDINARLADIVDVPLFIDNDGNCCCWGELVRNRNEFLKDFMFCLIKERKHKNGNDEISFPAIGLGFVIGGKVHYGRKLTAGEFRSIFAEKNGISQFSSEIGAISDFNSDDKVFRKFAEEFGQNIGLLVNTMALSYCFIGGELSGNYEYFSSVLQSSMDQNWSYPGKSLCSVRKSSMGEDAVAYGAAAMIIDKVFTIPGHSTGENEIINLLFKE
ncbi:MAG: ROK family transcriptional regulator [Spirochaetales bacterium]|nr:ROK family transcriptional regulator [Spirochaetales bacterium]